MSAWRMIAREMHAIDHPVKHTELSSYTARGIQQARMMKVVECIGTIGRYRWRLTQVGRDWCEGRAELQRSMPGGYRWTATWLRAMPVGVVVADGLVARARVWGSA